MREIPKCSVHESLVVKVPYQIRKGAVDLGIQLDRGIPPLQVSIDAGGLVDP